jgi:hypothetical protein
VLGLEELVVKDPCTFIYGKMSINGTLVKGEATCDARVVKIAYQCNGRI